MQFAPSTYYAAKTRPPSDRTLSDAELGPKLAELWKHNYSVYGRRKLLKAARRLNRSPSTISRELRRNASTRTYRLDYRASTDDDQVARSCSILNLAASGKIARQRRATF